MTHEYPQATSLFLSMDRDSFAGRLRHEAFIRAQVHSIIDDLSVTDIPLLEDLPMVR